MENSKRKIIVKKEIIIKILILIILILMIGITSFRSGSKFYLLKNMYLEDETTANIESGISRWYFNARVIYENEVIKNDFQ